MTQRLTFVTTRAHCAVSAQWLSVQLKRDRFDPTQCDCAHNMSNRLIDRIQDPNAIIVQSLISLYPNKAMPLF